MIHLVRGCDAANFPRWVEQMHRLRARAFSDRLNWDVKVVDGWERDRFDDCDPLYLMSVDEQGDLQGSLRLLPTTGPNMLRDIFSCLLSPGETVESATIWESSRFTTDLDRPYTTAYGKAVIAELLCGLIEVGLLVGLSFVVSVFDARMRRVLRSSNFPTDLIGRPQQIGRTLTHAGLFEISDDSWRSVARTGGIGGPTLARGSEAIARAA